MVQNIKISVRILPFGEMQLKFGQSVEIKPAKEEIPMYVEPLTTNVEKVEILYEGGKEYKLSETTDGK